MGQLTLPICLSFLWWKGIPKCWPAIIIENFFTGLTFPIFLSFLWWKGIQYWPAIDIVNLICIIIENFIMGQLTLPICLSFLRWKGIPKCCTTIIIENFFMGLMFSICLSFLWWKGSQTFPTLKYTFFHSMHFELYYTKVVVAVYWCIKSGTRRENRNVPDSPDLSLSIPDDRGYLQFLVFISRPVGKETNPRSSGIFPTYENRP